MCRAIRWALNLLTAASLALCVATSALWVRGHFRIDRTEWYWVTKRERVEPVEIDGQFVQPFPDEFQWCWTVRTYAVGGAMYVRVARGLDDTMKGRTFRASHSAQGSAGDVAYGAANLERVFGPRRWITDPAARQVIRLPGLRVDRLPRSPDSPYLAEGIVRLWLAAAATAVLPALWLRRRLGERRARRRAVVGGCRKCGYDLRATPGRCPECGTITSLTSTAAA